VLLQFVTCAAHFTLACLLWRSSRGVSSGAFHISLPLVAHSAWAPTGVVELVLPVVFYILCVRLKILTSFYVCKFTARRGRAR
jgi:hypothetical protein